MDSLIPSTSSSMPSENVNERQNAQEPILPSPNTSSNPDAAISADPARIDESNPANMNCLRREAESTKTKLNDQENQLRTIRTEVDTQKMELENLRTEKKDLENVLTTTRTEMDTQKNKFNALELNWANEKTHLTSGHALQLRQMVEAHAESLRLKEVELDEKQALVDALTRRNYRMRDEINELEEKLEEFKDMELEAIDELLTAEIKYLESKKQTEEAINEGKRMHSLQIGCALTAAVYQNRSAITEWSKLEKIICDLSSTIRSSLKCQFPDLQRALDLSREMKEKYEESLDKNLEDQRRRKSVDQEEEPNKLARPTRKREADRQLITSGKRVKSINRDTWAQSSQKGVILLECPEAVINFSSVAALSDVADLYLPVPGPGEFLKFVFPYNFTHFFPPCHIDIPCSPVQSYSNVLLSWFQPSFSSVNFIIIPFFQFVSRPIDLYVPHFLFVSLASRFPPTDSLPISGFSICPVIKNIPSFFELLFSSP
ncbi:Protein CBG21404 [Caenorhabditis briggsae]|uniref:Protein CBG21404 n=1 Tax=Caenorhabditis briggsae TaxID=6238 RepID=A8Y000_CAEBR|nr:Protein CBG21404 [Caenorhabditis briggsae]CAP38217.2 Protein CBG21404 [Caenorhabditis briggsae]